MKSGIYIIKNVNNGKVYIGSAVDIQNRFNAHEKLLCRNGHYNIHLQRAWNKDKKSSFSFKKYLGCKISNLIFYEQHTIDDFIARFGRKNLYNICLTAGSTAGIKLTESHKQKIGIAGLGRKHSEETKQHLSEVHIGKKMSKKSRMKLSRSLKGRIPWNKGKKGKKQSKETNEKNRQSHLGKKHTEKTKEKIRQALTGKPKSKEHIEKNRLAHLGKKMPPRTKEHRRNLSQALLGHPVTIETRRKISKTKKRKRFKK